MKLVLKLSIVLLTLNALVQAGMASWKQYQFKDAIEEELIFSDGRATKDALHGKIVDLAERLEVPIDPSEIDVAVQGARMQVTAQYTDQVTLVPRLYAPIWNFDASVEVRALR